MDRPAIEQIELRLFAEGVYQRYGYDYRNYSPASLSRRVRALMDQTGHKRVVDMLPAMLDDPGFLPLLVDAMSIPVTEMFRDPEFFRVLRSEIIPYLKTFPFVRIWHAGCATGEEAYSLAIILQEEGLYDRATIFATDINPTVLDKAREGIYALEAVKAYTGNYQKAGGKAAFSDYYHADYDSAIMDRTLRRNITFALHNLATDGVFSEMHLILCRNVLIYFDRTLQDRVLRLFDESLTHGGIMALGSKESITFSDVSRNFEELDPKWRLFKKVAAGSYPSRMP